MNLIGNKSDINKNYCYQNIIYAGKKFNMSYILKEALNRINIYYYCKIIEPLLLVQNQQKKITKKISICNTKIKYVKSELNYYWICDHSDECKKLSNTPIYNKQDLNNEISNYKQFRENLIEYLNKILLSNILILQ